MFPHGMPVSRRARPAKRPTPARIRLPRGNHGRGIPGTSRAMPNDRDTATVAALWIGTLLFVAGAGKMLAMELKTRAGMAKRYDVQSHNQKLP